MSQTSYASKNQPGAMSEMSLLGMWIFLVTEVMMFGAFFLVYAQYRFMHSQEFAEASRHLDTLLGTTNTGVLLTSSLTMAFAVHNAKSERSKWTLAFLIATVIMGTGFLGIKSFEYYSHWSEGLFPGSETQNWITKPPGFRLFYALYYSLTALHFIHVAVGLLLMTSFIFYRPFAKLSAWSKKVEGTGLYWHFVDIVWIFLFPLLYLIGGSQ